MGDEAKKKKVEAAKQKIKDLADNHRKAIERLDYWENKGMVNTPKEETMYNVTLDAVGDAVGGVDLREQVLNAFAVEENKKLVRA